jgi:hypothetical protein
VAVILLVQLATGYSLHPNLPQPIPTAPLAAAPAKSKHANFARHVQCHPPPRSWIALAHGIPAGAARAGLDLQPNLPQIIPTSWFAIAAGLTALLPAFCCGGDSAGADRVAVAGAAAGALRDTAGFLSAGADRVAVVRSAAGALRDTAGFLSVTQSPLSSSFWPLGQVLAMHFPFDSTSVLAHSSGQTRDGAFRIALRKSVEGSSGARGSLADLMNFMIDCFTAGDVQLSSSFPS